MREYFDTEGANRAAGRMECAAREARSAAERMEECIRQLQILTGPGYGNNVEVLIERLSEHEGRKDAALKRISVLGLCDADCNHSGEFLAARAIACEALGIQQPIKD